MNWKDILKNLERLNTEYGFIPPARELAAHFAEIRGTNVTEHSIIGAMEQMVKRGHIVRKKGWYSLKEPPKKQQIEEKKEPDPEPEKNQVEEMTEIPQNPSQDQRTEEITGAVASTTQEKENHPVEAKNLTGRIVRFGMLMVGGGATLVSVYYTSRKTEELLPFPLDYILSMAIIGYLVFSIDAAIIQIKKGRVFVPAILLLFWMVSASISFSAAVNGQYSAMTERMREEAAKDKAGISGERRLHSLEDKSTRLKEQIAGKRKEIEYYQRRITTGADVSRWYVERAESQYGELNRKLDESHDEISKILEESPEIAEGRRKGFMDSLSESTGYDRNKIELALSVLLALFADLIAPVAIAVALFVEE